MKKCFMVTLSRTLTVIVTMALIALSTPAVGQQTAEEILDRHIKATGGKAAYEKIHNRVAHGTMKIVNQGLELDITIYTARPNKNFSIIESQATGRIEKGCTGEVVWENSAISGPVIVEGAARHNAIRDSAFDRLIHWQNYYATAEIDGSDTVANSDCYRLVMTPKPAEDPESGEEIEQHPLIAFINKDTLLADKMEGNVVSPAGTIKIEFLISDYREIDGLLIPHKIETHVLGQRRILTVDNISQNAELPPDRFDPPSEVKELLAKKEGK